MQANNNLGLLTETLNLTPISTKVIALSAIQPWTKGHMAGKGHKIFTANFQINSVLLMGALKHFCQQHKGFLLSAA